MGLLFAPNAIAGPLEGEHAGPVRIAIVGASRERGDAWRGDALVASIAQWDPTAVLLTGGYVTRGSASEWRELMARWDSLADRLVAVPDRAARRGDGKLARWRDSGLGFGVEGLDEATWTRTTLISGGVRWGVLFLDTEARAMDSAWLDQRTWLPKAVVARDYDQLLIVTNRPLASLQNPPPTGGRAVQSLLTDFAAHGDRTRLLGVISGGTQTNEVLLHSGSFGEVHLVAGNGSVAAADLDRRGESPLGEVGEMALVDGFDEALREEWLAREQAAPSDTYDGDVLPVRGWWKVEIEGREMAIAFQMDDGRGGFDEVYRIRYTRRMGWVAGG